MRLHSKQGLVMFPVLGLHIFVVFLMTSTFSLAVLILQQRSGLIIRLIYVFSVLYAIADLVLFSRLWVAALPKRARHHIQSHEPHLAPKGT